MFTFAPTSWMVLTHSTLLLPGTYQSYNLQTFDTFYANISIWSIGTYNQMAHLESMIELDWRALWNFNKIKYQSIQNDLHVPMQTS